MSRTLSQEEKLRYPWASRITDFVPVGRWRRWGLWSAWIGAALYVVGAVAGYVFLGKVAAWHGVPTGILTVPVMGLGLIGMAAGFGMGLATLPKAISRNARSPIVWSAGAMVPLIIWLVGVLVA